MMHIRRILTSCLVFLLLAYGVLSIAHVSAQESPTPTSTPTPASAPTPTPVSNENDPSYQQKLKEIEELKKKINELQGQQKTLSDAIGYLSSKQALTKKQIEATQVEIVLIRKDLESLTGKIEVLESALNTLTANLLYEASQGYKQKFITSYDMLFSSKDFADFYSQYKNLKLAQQHHQTLLKKTTQARIDYDEEKIIKEKKQKAIEALQQRLAQQQKDLLVQEQAKQKLLTDTKNNESNYQKLLSQAESELASFKSFVVSRGAGILPPQNSPDGWFFSQRDERWAGACIGSSCGTRNEGRILEVGCLVSSTAMVKKKMGEDVTPLSIARTSSYFFSNTAYMLSPWPTPNGYRYERSSYNQDKLDAALRDGLPVIVHLRIGTRDGHFIVLKSGEKGDYTMHDPIEGFDKKFTSFYRINQINSISVLRKV